MRLKDKPLLSFLPALYIMVDINEEKNVVLYISSSRHYSESTYPDKTIMKWDGYIYGLSNDDSRFREHERRKFSITQEDIIQCLSRRRLVKTLSICNDRLRTMLVNPIMRLTRETAFSTNIYITREDVYEVYTDIVADEIDSDNWPMRSAELCRAIDIMNRTHNKFRGGKTTFTYSDYHREGWKENEMRLRADAKEDEVADIFALIVMYCDDFFTTRDP